MLEGLNSSEARLLRLVNGLTPEQWSFRETPERWSIAENIEHVILLESWISGIIVKILAEPADPEKTMPGPAKDELVRALSRTTKLNAREAMRPVGKWPDSAELMQEFRATRDRTLTFARETRANLRERCFAHISLGELDCYQWLLLLGKHGMRHAEQIEEIKANPAFPKT